MRRRMKEAEKRHVFSMFLVMLMFSTFLMAMVALVYPYRTFELQTDKLEVVNKEVMPGEKLYYKSYFCKYTNKPAIVSRTLVNDYLIHYSTFYSNYPEGCHNITIGIDIPTSASPGDYFVRVVLEYKVNPLRHIQVTLESEPFVILDKEREVC